MGALIIVIVGSITAVHGGTRIHAGVDCCISYYTDSWFKEFAQKMPSAGGFYPREPAGRGSRRQVHVLV